ncbi:hypothetical protein [Candidatus Contendibacter odensensis]|uniref:Phage head morphogenesis domain-containing protein n=1 Tax=Candidatus Contendobacter odensis Run_B_J11 TaxID=1400861 RepID=A0A7U7GEU0_9GAMM|nr:hypothetical protein [Candidatus Contendobacter odensis]CDH46954.1 hypothetical protein BN874_690004 [Candidatus Contendobacter odensis Run_B_J11]
MSAADDARWRALEHLTAGMEPGIADALDAAFLAIGSSLDLDYLIAELEAGHVDRVLALLADDRLVPAFTGAIHALREVTAKAGAWEASLISKMLATSLKPPVPPPGALPGWPPPPSAFAPKTMLFRFDALNPKLIDHIQSYEFDLIREITRQTRESVRSAVLAGMNAGENPRETARQIRQSIGLTERQQAAVGAFRKELQNFHLKQSAGTWNLGGKISRAPGGAQTFAVDQYGTPKDGIISRRLRDFRFDSTLQAAMDSGKPLSTAKIDQMVAAYTRKYLRYRSEMIARTEALRASNVGIHQAWKQAAAQGLVQEDLLRKRWLLALGSDRTCKHCRPMPKLNAGEEGYGIGVDDRFQTVKGDTVVRPPLHPACRCSVVIRQIEPGMVNPFA